MYRHMVHRCKKDVKMETEIKLNEEIIDLKKLVHLLKLQLNQKDVLIDIKNNQLEHYKNITS